MKQKKLWIAFLLVLAFSAGFAQNSTAIRKSKLLSLSFLLGKWEVTGGEKNSDGEWFDQIGTWDCYFDMDSTVIRIDLKFKVTRSTGSYDSLPRIRNFTEYIIFNTTRNMYQTVDHDAGTVSAANNLLVDIKTRTLKYYFSYYHPGKKATIDAVSILKGINDYEFSHIQELNSVDSNFKEIYTSTLKKIR